MLPIAGYVGGKIATDLASKAIFIGLVGLIGGGILTYLVYTISSGGAAKAELRFSRDIIKENNILIEKERQVNNSISTLLEKANMELSNNESKYNLLKQDRGPDCPISCLQDNIQ